jgi:nicotinamide phosphoribosyltransferase
MSQHNLRNIITNTDTFKNVHYNLFAPGMEYMSAYVEARGGEFPVSVFVGLQAFIREYLMTPLTLEDIDEAESVAREQGYPFGRDRWLGILADHDGYLPIEIEAVPEGTVLPVKNVLLQIVNTDPKYPWVANYFETALLRAIWYPTTVATVAWLTKQQARNSMAATSDRPELVETMLHDYGARGVSSTESAALGSLASLVSYSQTDTMPGVVAARKYYNADFAGRTSPNVEHAVISSWGRDREVDAIRNIITTYDQHGAVVVLTDTYDHENCVRNILGKELRQLVIDFPGVVVVRPDSGDPVMVTADTIGWLMEDFGFTVNSKGFKVLPPYLRVVQGDGLTRDLVTDIFIELERRGFATENAAIGFGGGLLQQVNRDTMAFAQKVNAVMVDGEWRNIQKKPSGNTLKHSKAGRLALTRDASGEYITVPRHTISPEENLLEVVFRNGKLIKKHDFHELVARAAADVPEHYYASYVAPLEQARAEVNAHSTPSFV